MYSICNDNATYLFTLLASVKLGTQCKNILDFKKESGGRGDMDVKSVIYRENKFALLWGEAQLCLPYVC